MRSIKILTSVLLLSTAMVAPQTAMAQLSVNISIGDPVAVAPPPLPVYIVPAPPADNLIWMPGNWQWSPYGYYWVPGTWVEAPNPGLLWTPGYWGWNSGSFVFHEGYWGEHVGFYGGINYGGGYGGSGFRGGNWNNGRYVVNRSVTNVTNITNVTNNYSFNGGPGGTKAAPTAQERSFAHEKHVPPTSEQTRQIQAASGNPQLRASANHGKPPVAATTKPGEFSGAGVVAAKQAGHKNALAEKHNQQVMKNPALAKGAAIPRAEGKEAPAQPRPAMENAPKNESRTQPEPNHQPMEPARPVEHPAEQPKPVEHPELNRAEEPKPPVEHPEMNRTAEPPKPAEHPEVNRAPEPPKPMPPHPEPAKVEPKPAPHPEPAKAEPKEAPHPEEKDEHKE